MVELLERYGGAYASIQFRAGQWWSGAGSNCRPSFQVKFDRRGTSLVVA
jgi:hypothetical protein